MAKVGRRSFMRFLASIGLITLSGNLLSEKSKNLLEIVEQQQESEITQQETTIPHMIPYPKDVDAAFTHVNWRIMCLTPLVTWSGSIYLRWITTILFQKSKEFHPKVVTRIIQNLLKKVFGTSVSIVFTVKILLALRFVQPELHIKIKMVWF